MMHIVNFNMAHTLTFCILCDTNYVTLNTNKCLMVYIVILFAIEMLCANLLRFSFNEK